MNDLSPIIKACEQVQTLRQHVQLKASRGRLDVNSQLIVCAHTSLDSLLAFYAQDINTFLEHVRMSPDGIDYAWLLYCFELGERHAMNHAPLATWVLHPELLSPYGVLCCTGFVIGYLVGFPKTETL